MVYGGAARWSQNEAALRMQVSGLRVQKSERRDPAAFVRRVLGPQLGREADVHEPAGGAGQRDAAAQPQRCLI